MSLEELNLGELGADQVIRLVVEAGEENLALTHNFIVIQPGEKPQCSMELEQPDGSVHFEERVLLEGSVAKQAERNKANGVTKVGQMAVIQGLTDRYGRTPIYQPIVEIRLR